MSFDGSDYGPVARLLHRLALGNGAVAEVAYTLDQKIARPDMSLAANGAHVFVAGMARAGTTLLTRRLFQTGRFASLTYADMPFPVAPNLWRQLRMGRAGGLQPKERAHGDGVIVDDASPEALDEAFWRLFDGQAYIRPDHLSRHEPDADLLGRYCGLVGAILRLCGKDRYLSKNNNNVLRLPELAKTFPNATFLIPFRAPLAHADSLLAQHRRFTEMHAANPFSRRYMGWLAHHEFGADQRPFLQADGRTDRDTRDYWVEQWCSLYAWLLEIAPENSVFVCYEDLCNSADTWVGLERLLGLDPTDGLEDIRAARCPELPDGGASANLYEDLRSRSRSDLAAGGLSERFELSRSA